MYIRLVAGLPSSGKTLHGKNWERYDGAVLFENPDISDNATRDRIKKEINKKNIVITHDDFCNPAIIGAAVNWFKKQIDLYSTRLECFHILPDINMHRKVFEYRKARKEKVDEDRFNELTKKYKSLYVPLNISSGMSCFRV